MGIWTVVDKSYIEVLLRNDLYITMAYVLIVAGVLVVFVSLVGCLGAVKEVSQSETRERKGNLIFFYGGEPRRTAEGN